MKDEIIRFKDWLISRNWKVITNDNMDVMLSCEFQKRYKNIDTEYFEFLKCFKRVISKDERTWFLCADEYNESSDFAFKWNEFELLSLEATQDDDEWKKEIEEWWTNKLPIILSVKSGYSFYAIDLDSDTGTIVKGIEPEFEETEIIANSFYEFLNMVIQGKIII